MFDATCLNVRCRSNQSFQRAKRSLPSDYARITMTDLLDESIDHQSMDWTDSHIAARLYSTRPLYQGIADTIVQLNRRSTSGVIVPSQSPED